MRARPVHALRIRKRRISDWVALLVQRYLSTKASFVYALFIVPRITIVCQIIRHSRRTPALTSSVKHVVPPDLSLNFPGCCRLYAGTIRETSRAQPAWRWRTQGTPVCGAGDAPCIVHYEYMAHDARQKHIRFLRAAMI